MLINFLALVCCLGNSAVIAGKTEVTFDVIDAEGTIASATAGIVKEYARDLKKSGKVRAYK